MSFDQIEIMRVEPTTEGGFWSYGGLNNELPPESNPWQYGTHMAPFDEEVTVNTAFKRSLDKFCFADLIFSKIFVLSYIQTKAIDKICKKMSIYETGIAWSKYP